MYVRVKAKREEEARGGGGGFGGVVVITSASHAEGPRFEPGSNHLCLYTFPHLFYVLGMWSRRKT